MFIQKSYSGFHLTESNSSVLPYSVINEYRVINENYYNWNIFESKMFKLYMQLTKAHHKNGIIYLYDGPDFHSNQYNLSTLMKFTSSSFQVSVIYQGDYSNIEIKFKSYIFIKAMKNYRKYSVKNNI